MADKLRKSAGDQTTVMYFRCPGCGKIHALTVRKDPNETRRPTWTWNGSMDKPTFTPSILATIAPGRRCHSFVTDGQIKFLNDCDHDLRGQTVELPDWEDRFFGEG